MDFVEVQTVKRLLGPAPPTGAKSFQLSLPRTEIYKLSAKVKLDLQL